MNMSQRRSVFGPRASLLTFTLIAPLVACSAGRGAARSPDSPVQAGQNAHGGPQWPAAAHADFTTSLVTVTIENNTESDHVFSSALKFLDVNGSDVVPPLVGPNVAVSAGTTSSSFVITYHPTLPDGYYNIALTVAATSPGSEEVYSGASGYLHVVDGVRTRIDFGDWNNQTGGGPVIPYIE